MPPKDTTTEPLAAVAQDVLLALSRTLLRADRRLKRAIVLATDMVACALAVILSFSIRLGYWQVLSEPVLIMIGVELVLFITVFVVSGIYSNLFRFHGARGLGQLVAACVALGFPTVAVFGLIGVSGVPRTVSILFPLIFFALVAASRMAARFILVDMMGRSGVERRVLIYGAGSAGLQLATSLAHETGYRLQGYLDDNPQLAGSRIEGVPIYRLSELEWAIAERGVEIVFLAMPSLPRAERAAIVERLQASNVHVLTLPGLGEIVDGKVSVSDLREIEVTDLLSRDPVAPDRELLRGTIEGKVVLVTGAGGSIGSELARQIVGLRPERLVLVEMSEAALYTVDQEARAIARELGVATEIVPELASVEKKSSTRRIFERYRPHTVYHAAAYKHVPMVEANVISGVSNNVRATHNCAIAACETGVERMILISTDKAVRPTNVMGASKRVCELVLQALARDGTYSTVFSMVRFGNVLGSSGSVVPRFKQQIAAGGPVEVTHRDITRYFMTIPEAAELVIQAGAMAEGGEVYLLDMGEPVRIMDLARTMIRLSGRSVRDEENPGGDVAIIETGLRPGEKLYEELLIDAEALPTAHQRIFRATEEHIEWAVLEPQLDALDRFAWDGDSAAIRALLRDLVPGFRPDGSPSQ
ncbi:MAG: polysaccharide biosynthesis protein [Sphingomonadaceae bacterium]|nr:polysaccharide biosynthesis protein [Sphingomonadaceae bacterium]